MSNKYNGKPNETCVNIPKIIMKNTNVMAAHTDKHIIDIFVMTDTIINILINTFIIVIIHMAMLIGHISNDKHCDD